MNLRQPWPTRAHLRWLAALTGVVVLWQALGAAPNTGRHDALLDVEEALRAQLAVHHSEQTMLLAALRELDGERNRRTDTAGRSDRPTAELLDARARMALIATLARDTSGLTLVSLNTTTSTPEAHQPALQRHRVVLEVEGGFFALLAYLEALEALPWALAWERLDIVVSDAGLPRMQLSLSALGPSEDSVHV